MRKTNSRTGFTEYLAVLREKKLQQREEQKRKLNKSLENVFILLNWCFYLLGQLCLGYLIISGAEKSSSIEGTVALIGGVIGFVACSILAYIILRELSKD